MSVNETMYGVPATRVCAFCADSIDCADNASDPAFTQAPVTPTAMLEALYTLTGRAVLSAVVDPVSPASVKMDCTVLHRAKTGTLVVIVMVMVLEAHGYVELWPMVDVILAARMFSGSASPGFTAVMEEETAKPEPETSELA